MGFKNKKSLGQNFLIDNNILYKIVKIGDLSKNDSVLEIGAGSGNLTRFILNEKPRDFTVVEKDFELVKILKKKFNNQIKIVHSDILNLEDDFYSEKFIVYGNLPYNISTKILANWCLTNKIMFKKLILMFQKEVADRIIAKENTREYGRITILANWKFNVKKVFDVSPECFFPKPKIKSTLLEFIPKKNQVHINDPENLEKITRIFFAQRRKMVKKNFIKLFKNFDFISKKINVKLTDRPQTISINKFLMIVKEYENNLN
tara:strand:- start:627 stop:1409 length:783 start_codon:yes stop_codon:yes gene_type:complete